MSRIKKLFQKKQQNILNVYFTAGFPELNSTLQIMKSLQACGVDLIELGMPYSDPLADGPVIQHSSAVAIANGMSIDTLFNQLKNCRAGISAGGIGDELPVILMGYMNPVLQYGFERFCAAASSVGIDGLIIPDLPEHEFESEYAAIIQQYGLDFIFLVTPETAEERVRKLDRLCSGFLYAVSSSSTTGSEKNMSDVDSYLQRLKNYGLHNPILAGFGIKDRSSFEAVCKKANGAIIGSAFIQAIENAADVNVATKKFIREIIS